MTSKLVKFFGGIILLGLIVGMVRITLGQSESNAAAQRWDITDNNTTQSTHSSTVETLLASGHFLKIESETEDTESKEDQAPPPAVVTFAALDGEDIIIVKLASGELVSAKVGDLVEGGWVVASISSKFDEAVFSKGDINYTFKAYENNRS